MIKRIRWYLWVLFALILVYVGVSVYFMEHFFAGTQVDGMSVEFAAVDEVNRKILDQANTYTLTLTGRNGDNVTLTKDDLGITFSETEEVRRVKRRQQNGFLWPRMFWQQDSYQIGADMTVDDGTFSGTLASLDLVVKGTAPEDAYVELTETGYELYPEVMGSQIDTAVLETQVRAAVENLDETLDLEAQGCYVNPSVTTESEAITTLTGQLDTWLGAAITYEFGPSTRVVDKDTIAGFITLENNTASLNLEAIAAWVANMASETDTYKKSHTFASTLRGTITVSGGNYGWQIDQTTESAALQASIGAGEVISKSPAYSHEALTRDGVNGDIGSTYIEVDMGAQHMWAYKNGALVVDTDVVTGNISRNFGTPSLVACIQYKERNATLRGDNYATPVNFWMPFYGNYGIHDATWRSEFGGEIYLTSGSHGCVNTPYAAMKVIFDNIPSGTPVVLFY